MRSLSWLAQTGPNAADRQVRAWPTHKGPPPHEPQLMREDRCDLPVPIECGLDPEGT